MPICPNGHDSADDEFCDVCGLAFDAQPVAAAPSPQATPKTDPEAPARECPACGSPLDGRFCESCGHDSLAAPPPRRSAAPSPSPSPSPEVAGAAHRPDSWTATVSADRAYYDSVIAAGGPDAGGITFPPFCPERFFPLRGQQISIGRRSASRGINPEIDLTGPPEDPGVSHLHGLLVAQPDGGWSIVDLGSANGTTVNNNPTPLRANIPQPLADGDRIHLGAWTTIAVRRDR